MVYGRPPNPDDSYTLGSIVSEQVPIGPEALSAYVRYGGLSPSPMMPYWCGPRPLAIRTGLDVYFEVSARLEGEQEVILPSADSKQAVAPKIFSFSSLALSTLPPPNTPRGP